MFGQNSNAMNNGPQCNTFMRPMTSDQSMLSLSLWNQNLSIRIRPAIGRDGNGVMQYDKNRQGQTALSPENCHALIEKFNQDIRQDYEAAKNGTPVSETKSISVTSGGASKNVTTITMKPNNDPTDSTATMELEVALNVDANGVAAEGNVYRHEFAKKAVFEGYSPATGPKGKTSVNSDFDTFLRIMGAVDNTENVGNIVAGHMEKYESMRYNQNNGSPSGTDFNTSGTFGGISSGNMAGGGFGMPSGGELPFN